MHTYIHTHSQTCGRNAAIVEPTSNGDCEMKWKPIPIMMRTPLHFMYVSISTKVNIYRYTYTHTHSRIPIILRTPLSVNM